MAATRRVDEEYMSDSSRIPQGMEILRQIVRLEIILMD